MPLMRFSTLSMSNCITRHIQERTNDQGLDLQLNK